jgi:hypothetical protein
MVPMVGRAMVYVAKVRWKVMRILSRIRLSRNFLARRIKNTLNGRNLPERFVDEVIRVLKAGIDKMMDPNYSLQESYKQRGTYGNPRGDNKRQRR